MLFDDVGDGRYLYRSVFLVDVIFFWMVFLECVVG